jgi:hypothetical protein
MACLSIIRDGGPTTVAANPIFPLDPVIIRGGAEIRFEVFEVNARRVEEPRRRASVFLYRRD